MKGMIRMRGIKMGMRGIGEGMQGIRVGMMGIRARMMGIRIGMRGIMGGIVEIRVRMQGIRIGMMGMRVGMRKMLGIRVGMWGTGGGNEENKGENLCIGVELTNYKLWRGTRNKKLCVSCYSVNVQRQPSLGVLQKRCSAKTQQIYWRSTMQKYGFNKVA